MNDHDALLAAIVDAPEDDLPRLAFADWCDEHGHGARAAFIRTQIAAEPLDESDPRRLVLEDRADELLAAHRDEWLGTLGTQTSRRTFRRGFVESASVETGRFLDCAEEMFRAWPLRHLRVHGPDGDYADDEGVGQITQSQALSKLAALTVFCGANSLGPDAVAALADCPHLTNLRTLDLNAHDPGKGIGAEGVRRLANSPHLRKVTALRLRWQDVGDEGARALAESPMLPRLRVLDLGAVQEISDAGLIALFSSPGAGRLRWVNLEHTIPGLEAIDAILGWGAKAKPIGLALGGMNWEASGRLGQASWLGGLTDVAIHNPPDRLFREARLERLHCGGATFLGRLHEQKDFENLRCFDASHNDFGAHQVRHLFRGDHLARLSSVSFWFSHLGEDGLKEMAQLPASSRLCHLNLRFSEVTTAGVKALASSPYSCNLRSLYLCDAELGTAGMKALAASQSLARLRDLDLCGVDATNAGVSALCQSFPSLRWLDLSSNDKLTDAAANALCRAEWPLLERLTLCHLPLSDKALQKLRERWGPRVEFATQDEWR
jgi:uncharacterized protein (TIGR02996 family)